MNRGTDRLRYAVASRDITLHRAKILRKKTLYTADGGRPRAELTLSSGATLSADAVLLATAGW